jgi:hypothetical protein
MKSIAENKPTHVVRGNVFDVLGFSASEASAFKIKAELPSAALQGAERSHPFLLISISYAFPVCCHGRGRGFEPRRPRH